MKNQSAEQSRAINQLAFGPLYREFSDKSLNVILIVLLGFLSTVTVRGQQGNIAYPENAIDSRMRTSMRVDPTSGALQFQIALGNYPGRAGTGMPIVLYYSSRVWRLEHLSTLGGCQGGFCYPQDSLYGAFFAENSAAGWTSNLDWFTWPSGESPIQTYDGDGRPADNSGTWRVARMFVRLPDGSKHELRRDDNVWAQSGYNGAGIYYAVDGSRLRYHTDTQTLWLPDGSRYVGNTQYIDRNGNTLNYNWTTRQWSDTLARTIGVPLPDSASIGEQYAASARDEYYSIPGVGGASLTYTFKWRYLTDVRTDPSQALRSKGDRVNNTNCQVVPSLFTSPSPCGGLDEDHRIMSTTPFNPVVLHQIVFPNGSTYTFTYNIYGEIDKIVYPTGGYEKFTFGQAPELSAHFMADQISNFFAGGNRGVFEQRISSDGTQGSEVLWQYILGPSNWTTGPDGTRTERRVHQSQGLSIAHGFDDPRAGLAYDERVWAPNSGPMLRRKLTEWLVDGTVEYYGSRIRYKTRNPRPSKEVEIILDTGGNALAATTTYQYDGDLNVISTKRYAFEEVDQSTAQNGTISSIPLGSLIRTEEADYLTNNQAYRDRNMLALPTATRIKNPAGTIISQSQTLYDEGTYPLLTCGASAGWGDPGTSVRGNATTGKFWLNTTGTWIETHTQYDQCGSVRKSWVGRGNVSEVQYSSAYQFAYPTTSLTPIPDPTGQTGSNVALSSSTTYDFSTGLVTSTTDQNNQVTSFTYNDPLNRLKQVIRPSGGGSTTYDYGDSPGDLYIREQTSLDTSRVIESYRYFDGLGRPHRSYLNEGGGFYLVTDTQYDGMGRTWKVSNPYRTTSLNGDINPSGQWTTTEFDAHGRVKILITSDGATVKTDYSGNRVLVADQNTTDSQRRKRISITDALGRLIEVWEVTNADSATEAITFPGWPDVAAGYRTRYQYDALDNLTRVTQQEGTSGHSQIREFNYDSLKRLTSAMNPESGTINYQYDNNGNLTKKTDARGVWIDYLYDALNRNTSVNYSNTAGTYPDIFRAYDGATNGKGRFWYSYAGDDYYNSSTVETTAVDSYDALGRPLVQRQHFKVNYVWSPAYQIQRTYNLAGGVTTQTYPSWRTVTYNYDQAGRLGDKDASNLAFSGNLGDGVHRTYSRGITYSPLGGIAKEQFGTDTALYNKSFYNSRGQLAEIRVSTSYTGPTDTTWNRGAIINHYSNGCWGMCGGESSTQNMTDNNGNLQKQEVYIPHNDQISSFTTWWQQYDYDSLNRLSAVREIGSSTLWQQQFVYDRWGNRTIHQTNTWGTAINKRNFTVDPQGTNRLLVPSGQSGVMQYDLAGNLINDTYSDEYTTGGTRTYNAENRMTAAQGGSQGTLQYYTYNADGQRTRRKVEGVETWQIYGMDGELLAEYAASDSPSVPQKEYGYRSGQLLITVSSAGQPVTENVVWTDALGVSVSGNSLTKTAATGWGNSGAVSSKSIVSGDGYVEFTVTETNTYRMFGLFTGGNNYSYEVLDFGLYARIDGTLYIYEEGVGCNCTLGTYAAGDKLRVAIEGGVVKYRKNGVLLYTSTATPTYPLRADGVLYSNGATITDAVISGNLAGLNPQNVTWTNVSSTIQVSGNSLLKVSGSPSWNDAGAVSTQTINSGDGYVEFTPGNTSTNRMGGLGTGDTSVHYSDIEYAFYVAGGSNLHIYEAGVDRGNFGTYAASDRLKVAVESGVVKYYRNGNLIYTSTVLPQYPLLVDTSLNTVNSYLENVVIATSSGGAGTSAIQWLVTDHLGTPRMIFDKTGSLANTKRHDYLPFGEELYAGQGLRTASLGYSGGDGIRQQFTQKERDIETGLDYFLARYYSPIQGRFTSSDDPFADWSTSDPQRWNLYSFTSNNPVIRVDDNGERWAKQQRADGKWVVEWFDHLDKDENGRTAYDRAILAGWSPITVDDLFVTEEGTGRRLLIGETADGRNPTREEISPAEEGYIRYHIQTLKRAREWEKWWNLPGLERELDAIPMAGGAIKGAIRFRDAVSVLRLRGLSLTAGWKKLRDLGLAMRITKTGRREFYDTVTGTVRAAWDAATSRGGNHWHKFAPNGKTPLNDAGRVVEKNSTAAHIPSK